LNGHGHEPASEELIATASHGIEENANCKMNNAK
jgi:hypothetical protein